MTHLQSFILFHGLVCVCQHSRSGSLLALSKNHFSFFAYSHRPLLDDADIYTSTLMIPCNSLNYDLIDTKLGTIVHLLIIYQPFGYMTKNVGINVAQHCVNG